MHDSDAVLDQLMSKAGLLVADAVAPVSAPVDRRHDYIALAGESAHLPGDAARRFLRSVLQKIDGRPVSSRPPFPPNPPRRRGIPEHEPAGFFRPPEAP